MRFCAASCEAKIIRPQARLPEGGIAYEYIM